MQFEKKMVTCTIVFLMALFLCLPAVALGGGSPNPVLREQNTVGPKIPAILIAGWKFVELCVGGGDDCGVVEVFLLVDGKKLYTGIINQLPFPAGYTRQNEFLDSTELDVSSYPLPWEIATDYGVAGGEPAIDDALNPRDPLEDVKDIDNFQMIEGVPDMDPFDPYDLPLTAYRHVLHCEIKISILKPHPGQGN